jgi:hypothetical protein
MRPGDLEQVESGVVRWRNEGRQAGLLEPGGEGARGHAGSVAMRPKSMRPPGTGAEISPPRAHQDGSDSPRGMRSPGKGSGPPPDLAAEQTDVLLLAV